MCSTWITIFIRCGRIFIILRQLSDIQCITNLKSRTKWVKHESIHTYYKWLYRMYARDHPINKSTWLNDKTTIQTNVHTLESLHNQLEYTRYIDCNAQVSFSLSLALNNIQYTYISILRQWLLIASWIKRNITKISKWMWRVKVQK